MVVVTLVGLGQPGLAVDTPDAVDDSYQAARDETLVVGAPGVLADDTVAGAGLELVDGPANGDPTAVVGQRVHLHTRSGVPSGPMPSRTSSRRRGDHSTLLADLFANGASRGPSDTTPIAALGSTILFAARDNAHGLELLQDPGGGRRRLAGR